MAFMFVVQIWLNLNNCCQCCWYILEKYSRVIYTLSFIALLWVLSKLSSSTVMWFIHVGVLRVELWRVDWFRMIDCKVSVLPSYIFSTDHVLWPWIVYNLSFSWSLFRLYQSGLSRRTESWAYVKLKIPSNSYEN